VTDYNEKILIVDDEPNILHILGTRLRLKGYSILFASDGKEALAVFIKETPDLVILDIMLPRLDGYEVCRQIREFSQVPIIMLTALGNVSEKILGLELGADDYIVKPFSPKELEARIKTVLRRAIAQSGGHSKTKVIYQLGNLVINLEKQDVLKNNEKIKLTSLEFNLLLLLINNSGKRLSRTEILDNIWGYTPERYIDTRLVDVHISRLRSKLEEDPGTPDLILTARGTGYMFRNY
jgi:OmpR family response regulator RpaB